jgi:hypothetical protein
MDVKKEGFASSLLVLGFSIFIIGFLTGMIAIAFIPVKPDVATLTLMVFIFGFLTGMITIALILVILKLRELNGRVLDKDLRG